MAAALRRTAVRIGPETKCARSLLPIVAPLFSTKCSVDAVNAKRHDDAVKNGKKTYRDFATGYRVFTRQAHLQRGKCCGSACRHCPFDHENVNRRR